MTDAVRQATETVERELRCARCGYVLRGLPVNGSCPECAEAIATSLRGSLLRFTDPDWLRSLARGATLSAWGVRLVFIMFFVYVFTLLATMPFYPPPDEEAGDPVAPILNGIVWTMYIMWLMTPILIGVGLWLLMKPEPREAGRSEIALLIERLLAAIVVPGFALWLAFAVDSFRITVPLIAHFIIIHLVFILALAHIWTIRQRLLDLHGRFEKQPRWGYLQTAGWRKWTAMAAPMIFLLLYWAGPFRATTPPMQGWTLPNQESDMGLLFGTVALWLIAAWMVAQYVPSIRHEVEQAKRSKT
jgi:hypothetical protein